MNALTIEEIENLNRSRICILGFGGAGEAIAVNLRRSGIAFKLGLRKDGRSATRARELGFEVLDFEEALSTADSVGMYLPDQVQADFYRKYLQNRSFKRLVFAHGFNTYFKLIPTLPAGPLHMLVAQKGAGTGLMEFYGTENALPVILSVEPREKFSDSEKIWAEAYAKAIGGNFKAFVWANFKDETVCDLFTEQSVLCGGISSLLRRTYEVLVEAGYHPETAYFESIFELKLIVDLIFQRGITGMRSKISPTARYGDITRGDRIIDASVKNRMQEVLREIESGKFKDEFLKDYGSESYRNLEAEQKEHPLEIVGKLLRARMRS